MLIDEAKIALDKVITKSRIHLYKPIQIAEILYRDRFFKDIDLSNLETYRTKSKAWRDEICIILLGRVSTSSAKYQDDLFNAIPPNLISALGEYNKKHNGIIEAYIYSRFFNKYTQLSNALNYCINASKETFYISHFIGLFWNEAGLRRSLDKIYEIVVYSLFDTLARALELNVSISINVDKLPILHEFEDFTHSLMRLNANNLCYTQKARIYRIGVTNAADRGLDMFANWGIAIQIKHLSLDEELAENIVSEIRSDKIIIVCKDADKSVIISLLTQIGWKARIQSIITESNLILWYEKALRGNFSHIIGDNLLETLRTEIAEEFPATKAIPEIILKRNYEEVSKEYNQKLFIF